MPQIPALSPEQLAEFEREGVLRLEGLISPDWFNPARDAVLFQLEKLGLYENGAWRRDGRQKPQWPDLGLKVARDIGHRHPEVEALREDRALLAVLDAVLEGHAFDRIVHRRPQVLCSLPNAEVWSLPTGWHTDSPRLASGERPGVQVFTFLEPVEARGGGTLVVAGSHRLLSNGRSLRPADIKPLLLRTEPFFEALYAGRANGDLPTGFSGDIPLRVVELTGSPGDAWIVDLRVLHGPAPNAGERPRIMVTDRFARADLMPQITAAYGWT